MKNRNNTKNFKVLILNWRDPKHPLAGGAEISLLEHVRYWHRKGAIITWFSSSFDGAKRKEDINGITYIRKGGHFTVHLWVLIYHITGKLPKSEIVIDNFHFIPFFSPIYLHKSKIIAFIHEVAGEVWYANLPRPLAFLGYHLEPHIFKLYKHVPFLTVSDSTKKELIDLGIPKEKINLIHNGVNRSKSNEGIKKENVPTIIFLGRISKDKGIEDVLQVYKKLISESLNIKLWIVGKEEKKGMMSQLIEKYNINRESVKYYGYVSESKKFELLKRAWILVHPSKKEGWGLSVIEAATQGTPTVGYDVFGLKDSIVHNETGILVNKDISELKDTILQLLKDTKKIKRLSRNALFFSKRFNWSTSGKLSWEVLVK